MKIALKKEGETLVLPTVEEFPEGSDYQYLISIDDMGFFMWKMETEEQKKWLDQQIEQETLSWNSAQAFRTLQPQHMAFGGVTGMQLARFAEQHQFCGRCGTRMVPSKTERAYCCPVCKAIDYPKISPAIIVGIINGDKILLTKYAAGEYRKYALVAGFMEVGETIEDTVRREVLEEVGVHIKNLRYYKSQPWSFSDSLMIGCFAELDGDDTIVRQEEELALAEWVRWDDIPEQESSFSIGWEMISLFKNQQVEAYFQGK